MSIDEPPDNQKPRERVVFEYDAGIPVKCDGQYLLSSPYEDSNQVLSSGITGSLNERIFEVFKTTPFG